MIDLAVAARIKRMGLGQGIVMLRRLILVSLMFAGWTGSGQGGEQDLTVVLKPSKRVVLSAEIAGRVSKVWHDVGDAFAASDMLIEIHDAVHAARVKKAEAEVRLAKARLQQVASLARERVVVGQAEAAERAASEELASYQTLYDDQQASKADLERARLQHVNAVAELAKAVAAEAPTLERAKTELTHAQADLQIAQYHLSACRIKAPFAGVVSRRVIEPHEYVQPGQPLVEILSQTTLRGRFLAPSTWLPELSENARLRMKIQETGTTVEGRIIQVSPEIDPVSETVEVFVEIDNPKGKLWPGMNGRISRAALPEAHKTGEGAP